MSSVTVDVRGERLEDVAAIRRVNELAFGGSVEAGIVDALRGTDAWIDGGSLVAVDGGGRLVGHLLLSTGRLVAEDGTERPIVMLGPVAVLPELQRRGIGGRLTRAAIELAIWRDQPLICLLGHADYYPRFGFEPARRIGIEPPRAWPDENWLALRLPSWTPDMRGTAHFARAFPDE